jgi:hypothetical protein
MDGFLNEFVPNLQAVIVFVVIAAPTFGYFYNRLMDNLKDEHEHTSLYVAIGVAITLAFGALISWKASLLLLSIFTLTGLPMIVGEFLRTEKKRKSVPRRKRLPYAANGLLDEAKMATNETHRLIGKALQASTPEEIYKYLASASHELTTINNKIVEVKQIQEK